MAQENFGPVGAQVGYGSDYPSATPPQYEVPLTGFSINARGSILLIEPVGTLAAGTIVLPSNPLNGQRFDVLSTQIVTALTLTAGAGDTVLAAVAPTTLAANTGLKFFYRLANRTWYRRP